MVKLKIESERIKKTMKDICQEEGNSKSYQLMCEIFDYLHSNDNMLIDDRVDNVKLKIDKADAKT